MTTKQRKKVGTIPRTASKQPLKTIKFPHTKDIPSNPEDLAKMNAGVNPAPVSLKVQKFHMLAELENGNIHHVVMAQEQGEWFTKFVAPNVVGRQITLGVRIEGLESIIPQQHVNSGLSVEVPEKVEDGCPDEEPKPTEPQTEPKSNDPEIV